MYVFSLLIITLGELGCYGSVNISLIRTSKEKTSSGLHTCVTLIAVGFLLRRQIAV